jgi:NADH:ubiquinone oxidoreductase subunit 5 (subunit L)/multisubunit Na+/H+ antiporter MnhA subunit
MGGLWHRMPITAVLWFSAALILSALPPTSGFVGKWLFFVGTFQTVQAHPIGLVVVVVAILASLMTLIYTFLAGIRIFFGRPNPDLDAAADPPLTMSLPLICLALLAVFLGLFPHPVLTLLQSVVGNL